MYALSSIELATRLQRGAAAMQCLPGFPGEKYAGLALLAAVPRQGKQLGGGRGPGRVGWREGMVQPGIQKCECNAEDGTSRAFTTLLLLLQYRTQPHLGCCLTAATAAASAIFMHLCTNSATP
jgi:hypothetical protein